MSRKRRPTIIKAAVATLALGAAAAIFLHQLRVRGAVPTETVQQLTKATAEATRALARAEAAPTRQPAPPPRMPTRPATPRLPPTQSAPPGPRGRGVPHIPPGSARAQVRALHKIAAYIGSVVASGVSTVAGAASGATSGVTTGAAGGAASGVTTGAASVKLHIKLPSIVQGAFAQPAASAGAIVPAAQARRYTLRNLYGIATVRKLLKAHEDVVKQAASAVQSMIQESTGLRHRRPPAPQFTGYVGPRTADSVTKWMQRHAPKMVTMNTWHAFATP